MPQMAPMLWIFILYMMTLLLILMLSKMFFFYTPTLAPKFFIINPNTNKMSMKW